MTALLRDMYVVGKIAAYMCPTVAHVDAHLGLLAQRLRASGARPDLLARLRADVDLLLDRRALLVAAQVPA